jgi:hypothetical protein
MRFDVLPLRGVNQLRFGMSRSEANSCFMGDPHEFSRGNDGIISSHFEYCGVFLYFDASHRLEAVELVEPAEVRLEGQELLRTNLESAISVLVEMDSGIKAEADGAYSRQLCIGLYAPFAKDDIRAPVEAVLVGQERYYD